MPRRIRRRRLDGWSDPHLLFRALNPDASHVVWLDGGGDASAGLSILGVAHASSEFVTADVAAGTISRSWPAASDRPTLTIPASVDDVFALLGERLGEYHVPEEATGAPGPVLGWFGWFGYEFGARIVGVPAARTDAPDAAFLWLDRAVVFDHARRSAELVWLDDDSDLDLDDDSVEAWSRETAAVWASLRPLAGADLAPDPATAPTASTPVARWRHGPATYAGLIAACQEAIHRGDAYQLCLTNRIDVDVTPDPASTYLALRETSPSHHGGYLRFGEHALLSASPELFLHVTSDGVVSTKPMKGTRPRHSDAEEDRRLRRELHESEKERAENLMIVDLMRNDLGRVAELGSVCVPEVMAVEPYAGLSHLVDVVRCVSVG